MSLQVTRRRAADEPCPADASRHERPLPRCSDTDGEIEPLVDEVDRAIGEIEVECKLRVRGRECGDRRSEMELAKRHATGQAQRPPRHDRRRAHGRFGLLEVGEQLDAALVKCLASLGEGQPPGGAVEQSHVEMLLELGDLPRDRRRRQAQALGRPRKAAQFHDLDEGVGGGETVHPHYYCV